MTVFRMILAAAAAALMLLYPAPDRLNADPGGVTLGRALELIDEEKYDEAAGFFGEYTLRYSSDSRGFNNLGFSLFKLGREKEALANYLKALETDPSYATAANNAGIAYYRLKEYASAEKMFTEAIRLRPEYARAYVNLGLVMLKLKNRKKAKELFLKAREIDKGYFAERLGSARSRHGSRLENFK